MTRQLWFEVSLHILGLCSNHSTGGARLVCCYIAGPSTFTEKISINEIRVSVAKRRILNQWMDTKLKAASNSKIVDCAWQWAKANDAWCTSRACFPAKQTFNACMEIIAKAERREVTQHQKLCLISVTKLQSKTIELTHEWKRTSRRQQQYFEHPGTLTITPRENSDTEGWTNMATESHFWAKTDSPLSQPKVKDLVLCTGE